MRNGWKRALCALLIALAAAACAEAAVLARGPVAEQICAADGKIFALCAQRLLVWDGRQVSEYEADAQARGERILCLISAQDSPAALTVRTRMEDGFSRIEGMYLRRIVPGEDGKFALEPMREIVPGSLYDGEYAEHIVQGALCGGEMYLLCGDGRLMKAGVDGVITETGEEQAACMAVLDGSVLLVQTRAGGISVQGGDGRGLVLPERPLRSIVCENGKLYGMDGLDAVCADLYSGQRRVIGRSEWGGDIVGMIADGKYIAVTPMGMEEFAIGG